MDSNIQVKDIITFMNFFNTPFWQAFVADLSATIIGIGIGIPVALLLNKLIEGITERQRKKKILELLYKELTTNLFNLKEWKEGKSNFDEIAVLEGLFKDQSWRAFSDGGELEWIKDPKLLDLFSNAYFGIRSLQLLCKKYNESLGYPDNLTTFNFRNVLMKAITGGIDFWISELDVIISKIKDKPKT